MLAFNPLTGKFDLVNDDTQYFKLDQTTPQTVINGVPIFNLGLTSNSTITNGGNLYMMNEGTFLEMWTDDADAIKIMSAGSNYSKLSLGVSTSFGYTYIQSVKDGTGTLLPISFWVGSGVGAVRAWDISTTGHLLAGGDGTGAQNITTAGTVSAEQLTSTDDAFIHGWLTVGNTIGGDGGITISAQGGMNYLTLSSNDAGTSDIYSVEQLYFRSADNDFTFMHNLYTGAYFRINVNGTNPLLTSSTGIFDFDNDDLTTTGNVEIKGELDNDYIKKYAMILGG